MSRISTLSHDIWEGKVLEVNEIIFKLYGYRVGALYGPMLRLHEDQTFTKALLLHTLFLTIYNTSLILYYCTVAQCPE